MGKLQYVNRKIGGQKLGSVVAKDLLKRLTPGTTRAAALRDPSIELDVSGKELDDEAATQISKALQKTYKANGDQTIVRLEEICFSGNMITTKALDTLSCTIQLAASHIRDLDLSCNRISVATESEQSSWERFLDALSSCKSLRRLDLSGNSLGIKGFETLAKAHARQNLLCTSAQIEEKFSGYEKTDCNLRKELPENKRLSPEVERSSLEFAGADGHENTTHNCLLGQTSVSINGPDHVSGDCVGLDLANLNVGTMVADNEPESKSNYKGLKSIPYVILDETGMDDACAMHLSFVIAEHKLPLELLPFVPPARAGAPYQQLLEYDQDPLCRGIMYRGNETISSDGRRVLELAEQSRDKRDRSRRDGDDLSLPPDKAPMTSERTSKRVTKDTFRSNVLGVASEAGAMQRRYLDLGIARSKIQAEILKQGSGGSEIWHVALQMLAIGRVIFLSVPGAVPTPPVPIGPCGSTAQRNRPLEWLERDYMGGSRRETLANLPVLGDANLNLSLTTRAQRMRAEVEAKATFPSILALGSSSGGDVSLKGRTDRPCIESATNTPYRSALLFGFSEEIWGQILAMAVDTNGTTNTKQQRAIVKWASDRSTIRKELAELGKQRANQIWMVLHGMGCLVYE